MRRNVGTNVLQPGARETHDTNLALVNLVLARLCQGRTQEMILESLEAALSFLCWRRAVPVIRRGHVRG